MTLRKRIVEALENYFLCSSAYYTAVEIKRMLDHSRIIHPQVVKLSSLSSVLKRMYDAGELERIDGVGPRGGFGYRVK